MSHTQNDIEQAYKAKLEEYSHRERRRRATQTESVLYFLLEHPEKIWWWPWELIGKTTSNGHYLSHKAPARASDLAIYEPHLVEDRSVGRFKIYRLRTENMSLIKTRLGM
jgi:hypothetical protein